MLSLDLNPDELAERLLAIAETDRVCILDSCGPGDGFLIGGVGPAFSERIASPDCDASMRGLERALAEAPATVFTVSYDLGLKLHGIASRHEPGPEPDLFISGFRALVFHDYARAETFIEGESRTAEILRERLLSTRGSSDPGIGPASASVRAETGRAAYLNSVEAIRELIREGETYQANLTQKFLVPVEENDSARAIYRRLRNSHPSAYSAFIDREKDEVVSISPERFFRIRGRLIETAPIKGTRKRTGDPASDELAKAELAMSGKDRAENIMITDLLRNDLGRVCDFGTVEVGSLCSVEELPSLYHLVSTIRGRLRTDAGFSEVLRALFPCGSITGAPKHRTMEIIDRIEPSARGLSMGAIGLNADCGAFPEFGRRAAIGGGGSGGRYSDLSVAIRTMVVRNGIAEFNTGGGVVIDSDPGLEYAESLDKAAAIFDALGVRDRPSATG